MRFGEQVGMVFFGTESSRAGADDAIGDDCPLRMTVLHECSSVFYPSDNPDASYLLFWIKISWNEGKESETRRVTCHGVPPDTVTCIMSHNGYRVTRRVMREANLPVSGCFLPSSQFPSAVRYDRRRHGRD